MPDNWGRTALHSVEALEGIGPKLAQQMAQMRLGTVEEFASLNMSALKGVADVIKGLSEQQMRGLLSQAWFHLLGDDGAEAAGALVENGIRTYVQLVATPTNRFVSVIGGNWDVNRAAQLQLAAARASWCFKVLLRVVDGADNPLTPRLQVGGVGFDAGERVVTRDGDADGWVLSPWLRRDRAHHLSIVAGSQRRSLYVRAAPAQVKRITVQFGQQPRGSVDEAKRPPAIRLLSGQETIVVEEAPLSALSPGTPLRMTRLKDGTANLLGLYRKFSGNTVVVTRVDVDAAILPSGAQPGSVLLIDNHSSLRLATAQEETDLITDRGFNRFKR